MLPRSITMYSISSSYSVSSSSSVSGLKMSGSRSRVEGFDLGEERVGENVDTWV